MPGKDSAKEYFRISVAGKSVIVFCRDRTVFRQCRGFLSHFDEPDIVIEATDEDIAYERRLTGQEDRGVNGIAVTSSFGYLESLAVHRKIAEEMLAFDTFLMHGAAVADGQGAYLFTAKSGTGKTTHVKKWLENVPDAYVVNGDKPLLEITAAGAFVHGTPWCGKEKLGCNGKAPLRAVILQQRGEDNRAEEITFGQALPTLLQQTYRPNDPEKMKKTLSLLAELGKRVRFYRFTCNNMKPDAFRTAYDALHEK